jgi:hypothetical protein
MNPAPAISKYRGTTLARSPGRQKGSKIRKPDLPKLNYQQVNVFQGLFFVHSAKFYNEMVNHLIAEVSRG